ncbi:hypothetical protein F4604DRAFT_1800204 [Suillus subluteus]|nr:hypothetical protein F4604DRAFT_1800204 [Suillus subluteus]
MNIVISTWVLVTARMMFAFPLVYVRVKNHTEIDDEVLLVPLCCPAILLTIFTYRFPQTQCRETSYEHVFDFMPSRLVFRFFEC